MSDFAIETARLTLREWRDTDLDALHRLCTDPAVMATIGPLLDRAAARAFLAKLQNRARQTGHTFWALERRSDARVLGFTGIARSEVPAIAGALEIGWRLGSEYWGQGFAREAAEASLDWSAKERPGEQVVAITAVINSRSRGLMERLGMRRLTDRDFDHPSVPEGNPLRPHVVYAIDPSFRVAGDLRG